ncbi:MAG: hypothetical protein PVJ02_05045, partial [Gemmatimonadota bacterium]
PDTPGSSGLPPTDGLEGGGGALTSEAWPFLLLSLGLLAVGLSFWRPIPAGVWNDDGVYMLIGKALAGGQGLRYAGVPGSPPAVKFPPGYPALLATLWLVFRGIGPVTLAAELLNLAMVAAAGGLAAWALHRGAGLRRSVAVGIAGLAFVSADVWQPALVPLSEALFYLLGAGALAAWVAASRPDDRRGAVWLAVILAVAMLTRSAAAALVLAFGAALLLRRGVRVTLAVCAPAVVAAVGWGIWASARAPEIPEGMRDVLGPYGGWLLAQVLGARAAFLHDLGPHAAAVAARVAALLVPGLWSVWLWIAAVPLALLAVVGGVRLGRVLPPVPWVILAYLAMLLVWPFVDRRLVAPLHPWMVMAVSFGFLELGRRAARSPMRWAVGAVAFAWVGAYAVVTASRAERGWAVAGYQLRAKRMAAAVEALKRTAPPDAVVGAPEFWAALHLHGGWLSVPSARFTPRAEDEEAPVWGTPEEQLALWWNAGVNHVLLEQGGQVHGDALNLLEERCPRDVGILARMPPQILVRLEWDRACAEKLGLVAGAGSGAPRARGDVGG